MSNNNNSARKDLELNDLIKLILQITIPFIVKNIFEEVSIVPLLVTGIILVSLSWVIFKPRWKKITSTAVVLIVLLSLGGYSYFANRPTFSLTLLNLPYNDADTYYVTDAMVRAKGDLTHYDDFTIAPLELEIVPHYTGRNRLGNVVLRIVGVDKTKDFPLWPDFDKASQSQTVQIPLSDIIDLSQIKVNYRELETSLSLEEKPYQTASLSFQVIQLSNPDKPFDYSKELTVKNSPWVQSTRIVDRSGTIMLDYALTNLGAEAKFYCKLTTAKVLGEVDEDHDFWSGIDVFAYGPDCPPFVLKTGETFKTSFSLDKGTLGQEFERGRYLVQVYTYAERGDLVLTDNASYETAYDMWVIGMDAQVSTFVICYDPGKTCEQSLSLPTERSSIQAFSYDSQEQYLNGYSYLVTYSRLVENQIANRYRLDYAIDPERDGWVGFAIVFTDLVDVSQFDALQFNLELDDGAYPVWIQLSGTDGQAEVRNRVLIGDGNYGLGSADEQPVVIPLSAFPDIDRKSIVAINFIFDNYMVPDAKLHQLQVSDIEFIHQ